MTQQARGRPARGGPPPRPHGTTEISALACLIFAEALVTLPIFSFPAWLAGMVQLLRSRVWPASAKNTAFFVLASGFPLMMAVTVLTPAFRRLGPLMLGMVIAGIVVYLVLQIRTVRRLLTTP